MFKRSLLISMSAAILVAMIGITACDNASPLADRSIDPQSPGLIESSSPATVDSTVITLATGVTSGTSELDALDGQQDFINLDAYTSDPSVLTNTVNVTVPYEPPASSPGQVNILHQVYKYAPRNILYDGNSQLQFQVDGTQYIGTMDGFDQELMYWLQIYRNYANEGPGEFPSSNSAAGTTQSKSKNEKEVNIREMTEQQIKKMLKDEGYKVRKLGNRRFELIRRVGDKKSKRKLYMHSIFDANTEKMTPLSITRNKKRLSKSLVKTKNGKRKRITRTNHALFNKKAKKIYMKTISNQ